MISRDGRPNRRNKDAFYKMFRRSVDYIINSLHLGQKCARIFVCYEKRTVFRERSPRKAVNSEKQMRTKNKDLSIFSRQMEVFAFIILRSCSATKIGESRVMRLD